ncbi:hypothetical protein BDR04DRAFT_850828 [Suillus decipiens]|nr:hypothetical protein BDR04DRAFT_850828 [Suillus decipiens]
MLSPGNRRCHLLLRHFMSQTTPLRILYHRHRAPACFPDIYDIFQRSTEHSEGPFFLFQSLIEGLPYHCASSRGYLFLYGSSLLCLGRQVAR